MYDTIHLRLPIEDIIDFNLDVVCSCLDKISEHYYDSGQHQISGKIGENMKVGISNKNITIKGSLAKYYFGNNFETLTITQTQEAIVKLSNKLGLPIYDAIVTRVDFSDNIIVDFKPQAYYNYLGNCTYFTRNSIKANTLYYNGSSMTKLFYDKIAWAKSKNVSIPKDLIGKNVLRYELRYEKRLKNQFNLPEVKAHTLYDYDFYLRLLNNWKQEYSSILKLGNVTFNFEHIKTPKQLSRNFELIGMESLGYSRVMKEIDNLKQQGIMNNNEYYSRAKNRVKTLFTDSNQTATSDLIIELDSKINQIVDRGI